MPTNDTTVDPDALIEQVRMLPEAEALDFYGRLTPRLQWLARQRTTGRRLHAIIAHHLRTRNRAGNEP